ncbi:hypothetical protein HAX54_006173, partial [Datura stramonium]|nr:hypothetical protein [Datura stramonium]
MGDASKQCKHGLGRLRIFQLKASSGLVGTQEDYIGRQLPICLEVSSTGGWNNSGVHLWADLVGKINVMSHLIMRLLFLLNFLNCCTSCWDDPNISIIWGAPVHNRMPLGIEETVRQGEGGGWAFPDTLGIGESLKPKNWEGHKSSLLSGLPLELLSYDFSHIDMNASHDTGNENGYLNGDMCGILGLNEMGAHK